MASRMSNIRGLATNSRSRAVLVIVGVILLFITVWGVLSLGKSSKNQVPGAANVPRPPMVQPIPGTSTDPQYRGTVEQANEAGAREAEATGRSHVPILPSSNKTPQASDPFGIPPPQSAPIIPVPPPATARPAPATLAPQVPRQPTQEESAAARGAYAKAERQVLGYLALWKPALGTQEFNYVGVENKAPAEAAAAPAAAGSTPAAAAGPLMVRAGTVIPALMITPLNSDSPGPVLADIVSGPLKGGRVIGNFQASEDQIVVRFQTLSMPGHGKSYRIDAFAVGTDMQAGLATDINHHYFKRFGLTAAAAFVRGYGQAIGRQNTTITTGPFGSTVAYGELSSSQVNKAALGEVGSSIGQQLTREANVRPTIKAEGQDGGALSIGLLFLSDF